MARLFIFITLMVTSTSFNAGAQVYWVVETNRQAKTSMVRLYNDRHELVFEEKRDGRYIDVSKARQRRKLNALVNRYNRDSGWISRRKSGQRLSSRQY
jgi:hypothetical protein